MESHKIFDFSGFCRFTFPVKKIAFSRAKRLVFLLPIAAVVIALDQWTKTWIVSHLGRFEFRTVIDPIFHIVHVHNTGAAFGFLARWAHGATLLTATSCVAVSGILAYFFAVRLLSPMSLVIFPLIVGGALGNLIDRLKYGYVIDFIDWHYKDVYHWPAFNIADAAISTAITLLVLELFLESKKV